MCVCRDLVLRHSTAGQVQQAIDQLATTTQTDAAAIASEAVTAAAAPQTMASVLAGLEARAGSDDEGDN